MAQMAEVVFEPVSGKQVCQVPTNISHLRRYR